MKRAITFICIGIVLLLISYLSCPINVPVGKDVWLVMTSFISGAAGLLCCVIGVCGIFDSLEGL